MEIFTLSRSKVRQKLLDRLFSEPGKRFYLSELSRLAATSAGNTQRELNRLLEEGLVLREKRGKFAFYAANPNHDLFPEIRAIVRKTCGLEGTLRAYFRTRPEVQIAYLFGSQATGKTTALSDVDVAVLVDPAQIPSSLPYGYKAEIITDLMQRLKTNRVDLVLLNEARPFLRYQVLKTGRCLFSRSRLEKSRFEANALERYWDLRPFLRAHREFKEAA